jgi:tetratricopeptide (TPR) repeat protein
VEFPANSSLLFQLKKFVGRLNAPHDDEQVQTHPGSGDMARRMHGSFFVTALLLSLAVTALARGNADRDETLKGSDSAFEEGDHITSGRMAEALLIQNPCDPEAAWRLSRALIVTSNLEKNRKHQLELLTRALSLSELAISEGPDSSQSYTCLAICRVNLAGLEGGRRQIELAKSGRTAAEKALELNPDNFLACLVLGAWHREIATCGRFSRAIAKIVYGGLPVDATLEQSEMYLRRAVALAPDRINPYHELGITFMEMKRYEEARQAFEKALSLSIKSPDDAIYLEDTRKCLKKVRRKLR